MARSISKFSLILLSLSVLSAPVFAAADFALPDVNGKQQKLSDFRGKWVVVNYWATWCGPCLEEIPGLEKFHEKHKNKDAVVLGVNTEDIGLKDLVQFVGEQKMTYPVLVGGPVDESPLGPIYGLPSTFLISPDGEIATSQVGPITPEDIEKFIATNPQIVPATPQTRKDTMADEAPVWKVWKHNKG